MLLKYLILFFIILGNVCLLKAQSSPADTLQSKTKTEIKRVELTIMPFMSYNRNLEVMFGVMPMAMYRIDDNDTISPKSLSGILPLLTTNGSKFIGCFNVLYLKEDTWRITFFGGTGDLCSQFFMEEPGSPGQFMDYLTNSTLINCGFKRKIIPNLYGGLSYTYARYHTTYEDDVVDESYTETNALGVDILWDTRDGAYYPTRGSKAKIHWNSYPSFMGNSVEANKIKASYNQYNSFREGHDVLATRFSAVIGLGEIPFEQQVTIGNKNIRGYTEGKYRGDGLLAAQGEYRYNLKNRIGFVGFAGLATIYGSDTKSFNWSLYPGGGVGCRYQAFKSTRFNVGLDAALGKDDWGVYFRIGEAF